MKIDFMTGFAEGLGTDNLAQADAHWAAYSRQLSDSEREADEAQGYARGLELGKQCAKL